MSNFMIDNQEYNAFGSFLKHSNSASYHRKWWSHAERSESYFL